MRRTVVVAGALAVAALSPLWNLATSPVTIPQRWRPLLWAVALLLAVVAVVAELRGQFSENRTDENADEKVDRLAAAVHVQWQREEERQRVYDPLPIPVRWRNAPGRLIDRPANYRDAPAGAVVEPLDLSGELTQIAATYRQVPSGRMVILGRSGSGKTVLAIRLLLDLLATRDAADPVPVIFSLGSWNPRTASLRGWLADQLIRDHPGLAAPAPDGRSLAAMLIREDRILPILDGFDEIAEGLRRDALNGLNTFSSPLVLTSRRSEYATAVTGTRVLARAAGIELTDLTLTDLLDYLQRTGATGVTTSMWDEALTKVLDRPHRRASVNLTTVLRTPLMLGLARSIYSDMPDHNPLELLDDVRFPTAESLEDHLLATFLSVVYQTEPEDHQRWSPEHVQRWLRYLARHLHRLEPTRPGGDLAWWRLGDTLRRPTRMLVVGVTVGLIIGLVDWVVASLVYGYLADPRLGSEAWLGLGLAEGLLTGSVAGLTFGLAHGLLTAFGGAAFEPSRVRVRIRGGVRVGRLVPRLRVGFVGGLLYGLTSGLLAGAVAKPAFGIVAGGPVDWLRAGLVDALLWGLAYGSATGLVGALMAWFEAPVDIRAAVTPSGLLNTNRMTVVIQLLLFGPLLGLLSMLGLWGAVGLLRDSVGPLTLMLTFEGALVFGSVIAFGGGFGVILTLTAWGQWVLFGRLWLPLTRRLPWAVAAFLKDAHRRQVLRQAGAVYQFRHARLQAHLLVGTPAPTEPPVATPRAAAPTVESTTS